ncbi:preprotein translocase subunit SecG [Paraferrimonas sp. SM1919]|uniref:preprotein translocase subunit SecG n=1 Tax=Paraferrimonas sp. SM1919 TaxID=2662263 RepID=UPI0013D129D1|nr:preprotein translocase subunit SecG [Paraferrimonas sp. SM1919]
MYDVLIVLYVIVAIALIGLVLIQQGKGADMGASFGAGSSATLFGSSGSGNFLTRTTAILAVGFFVLSLLIGRMSANNVNPQVGFEDLSVPVQTEEVVEQPKQDKIPD